MIWEFRGYSLAQSVESGFFVGLKKSVWVWIPVRVTSGGSAIQFCVLFSFYLPINPRHRTLSDVRQLRRCTVHIVLVLRLSVYVVSIVSSPSVSDFAAVAASSA